MHLDDNQIASFKTWMSNRGAIVIPGCTDYEIIRADTAFGILSAYQSLKGKQSYDAKLIELVRAWQANATPKLGVQYKGRYRSQSLVDQLAKRDGCECWYCALCFEGTRDDRITIEHLLARIFGGNNHHANLTLSCQPCNNKAGSLPIVDKIKFRDQKRAERARREQCVTAS